MKAFPLIAVALLVLSGCGGGPAPAAEGDTGPTVPPVPIMKVGEPVAVDLFGDGQATITVAGTELSALPDNRERLVVTVDILLNKAGEPVSGGPENFVFRDAGKVLHQARTSEQAFPPQLPTVSFTAAGQKSHGRLFFDLPSGSAAGGHIQLITGALVHAVWSV